MLGSRINAICPAVGEFGARRYKTGYKPGYKPGNTPDSRIAARTVS